MRRHALILTTVFALTAGASTGCDRSAPAAAPEPSKDDLTSDVQALEDLLPPNRT